VPDVPNLVHRAEALATAMRFELSSTPEIGRLLAVLASTKPRGRFAEIGTGVGVGSAWIADSMGPEASFVTVEVDADRAGAAARLFEDRPNVSVLHGDWHKLLPPEGPFDLLFFDGGQWKRLPAEEVARECGLALELVAPAGIVVIDDLTPKSLWLEEWRDKPDPAREVWLAREDLVVTELLTTPETAALLVVRR
jgi:predicted O-methyltransferase YrrM